MAIAKTEVFEMDRRQLLKLTGTMGIGAYFVSPTALAAAGMCEKVDIDNGQVNAQPASSALQFWIDGLQFTGERTGVARDATHTDVVPSRANITLFMDLVQTPRSYVESVVLMDDANHTIGARFFDSSMKMSDGRVPYVRFDNIALDPKSKYHCVYTVRRSSNVALYKATISKPVVSALNTAWLPQRMREDFETFLQTDTQGKPYPNATPGLITTQFQFYTLNGLDQHTARGRVKEIGSDGSFKINVDFMHGDLAADHFMRYFIVMDPVGRLLGFAKRAFGDANNNGSSGNTWDVTPVTAEQRGNGANGYAIPDLQVANILDCPYIQFYTEDSYDAIARNIIRLR